MFQEIIMPSKSTDISSKNTKRNILQGNQEFLINKWKKTINQDYEKELMEILERFKIDIYQYNNILPQKKYFH